MNKTTLIGTIVFQFTVLFVLAGILVFQLVNGQEMNEVALGAIIATFYGIPAAVISLMKAEDDE